MSRENLPPWRTLAKALYRRLANHLDGLIGPHPAAASSPPRPTPSDLAEICEAYRQQEPLAPDGTFNGPIARLQLFFADLQTREAEARRLVRSIEPEPDHTGIPPWSQASQPGGSDHGPFCGCGCRPRLSVSREL